MDSKPKEVPSEMQGGAEVIINDGISPGSQSNPQKFPQSILAFHDLQVSVPGSSSHCSSTVSDTPEHSEPKGPETPPAGGVRPPPLQIKWRQLKMTMWAPLKKIRGESEKMEILRGISGQLRGGELTAILGPSGAGKTTLLDALVGRGGGKMRGRVLLDGQEFDESFRDMTAYVTQDDTLFPYLTVRENLMFAAAVKMPASDPWDEKERRVREVIEALGLNAVANGLIGSVSRRGVSGGERRRVSIGAGIVHHPRVLLLDEPLSGLDSAHAFQVVSRLQQMAHAGAIVALTVHQPSMRISSLFDRVMVMVSGQVKFAGAISEIPPRLAALQRTPESSGALYGGNFVEQYLELLLEGAVSRPRDDGSRSDPDSDSCTDSASGHDVTKQSTDDTEAPASATRARRRPRSRGSLYANGHVREIVLLTWRTHLIQMRMPELFLVRIILVSGIGIIVATLFKQLQPTPEGLRGTFSFVATCLAVAYFESNNALPAYIEERVIIGKETFQKLYRPSTYVIASTISGVPVSAVLALIYSLETWWIVGLKGGAAGFAYYWLIVFLCFIVGTSFASLASALVPNYSIGISLVICVSFGLYLVSGYFQNRHAMPRYWLWLHYSSHFKYPYEAILTQQLERTPCVRLGNGATCQSNGWDVLEPEGIEVVSKWASVGIMLAFAIAYRVAFYVALLVRIAVRAF